MRLCAVGLAVLMGSLSGCGSHFSETQERETSEYTAQLQIQREAMRSVKVYDFLPAGATPIKVVNSAFCSFGSGAKDDYDSLIIGLKRKAFDAGANGIANVKSMLLPMADGHCEYGGIGGTAQAFILHRE